MDVKKAIEGKNAAFKYAYNQGDAMRCVEVFAEDVIMMPPNQPMAHDKKAYQDLVQGWIDNIGGTISNPMMEFSAEGDLAYQVATYAFKDTKTPEQGKYVEIFRRQQDGSWKVILTIYNSDQSL